MMGVFIILQVVEYDIHVYFNVAVFMLNKIGIKIFKNIKYL